MSTVNIGDTVTVRSDGDDATYTIVPKRTGNDFGDSIIPESPLAKALIGAAVGDTVRVEAPDPYEVVIVRIN